MKVYLIRTEEETPRYKIGFTRRDVKKRLKEFQTGNSLGLEIVGTFESKWGPKIEASMHRAYQGSKIGGEWFSLTEEQAAGFGSQCQRLHDLFEMMTRENTWIADGGKF